MKYIIPLLAFFVLSNLGLCQEPELKSTKAKAAVRDYERKIEDVDEDFGKQLKNLEKSYQMKSEILRARLLSNLNAAMEEEAKRVRLEEANKIKELIKQRKETELPTLDQLKWKAAKAKIPKTAVKFNGHRYAVVMEPMTPHVAQMFAKTFGGHVVRIESMQENEFVKSLVSNMESRSFWIDGSDEINEGVWVYTNGDPLVYSNWTVSSPDNTQNNEHHIELRKDGGWNDYFSNRAPFIIEWEK